MSQLEEIRARADELVRINTRDLASNLIEYGAEYLLVANVEADHRRLIAALEAMEALHRPDADTGKCEECTYARFSTASVRYPCPTIQAITEALA